MVNQLCRSAETNHRNAESITVSRGNTSPQPSVFIKAHLSERRYVWNAPSRLPEVSRAACNLDIDKRGDSSGGINPPDPLVNPG